MLTQKKAIEIAKLEFESHGHLASAYDISVETHEANDGEWIVWFDLRGQFKIPGGRHSVLIDKVTGRSTFMMGE